MDRKFVEFILEISRELKVDVVAEFVESEDIVNFFRQNYRHGNGVAFLGQGYFFGKPEVLFDD
jgi:EAL domain-containing protein (putative c-di-GMP-specific phosphodiesterase class I)